MTKERAGRYICAVTSTQGHTVYKTAQLNVVTAFSPDGLSGKPPPPPRIRPPIVPAEYSKNTHHFSQECHLIKRGFDELNLYDNSSPHLYGTR
ncbi:hypothetical protein KIN20_021546 [Parelaphostrongylus tenuis]|uniref:Uncharacterized protein n=1 Tax=Parelaphostrongylus tenuis TaxID=148309 RepID=A0AAD5N4M5_PARTN|nr:hypothetical protein KIN20_021546 [Parelaphostrongylus tenuis]